MTPKRFYDWQTSGGTDDVMRLVDVLERADVGWCAIGGVAVNHWVEQPNDLADIARLVEAHPRLWNDLPEELKTQVERPS